MASQQNMTSFKQFTGFPDDKAKKILIIGQPECGKSTLIASLIKEINYDNLLIVSKREKMVPFYRPLFPNAIVHYKFTEYIVKNILKIQSNEIGNGNPLKHILLVLDDCFVSDFNLSKCSEIHELLYNSSNCNITCILTMQNQLISPNLRSQFEYFFIFAYDNIVDQKRIYSYYFGMFVSFDYFRKVFTNLTENHNCLVVHNKCGVQICDRIFYYDVPIQKPLTDVHLTHKKYSGKQYNKKLNEKIFGVRKQHDIENENLKECVDAIRDIFRGISIVYKHMVPHNHHSNEVIHFIEFALAILSNDESPFRDIIVQQMKELVAQIIDADIESLNKVNVIEKRNDNITETSEEPESANESDIDLNDNDKLEDENEDKLEDENEGKLEDDNEDDDCLSSVSSISSCNEVGLFRK
jgi:GTP-binding protein EngB required for normal cell division